MVGGKRNPQRVSPASSSVSAVPRQRYENTGLGRKIGGWLGEAAEDFVGFMGWGDYDEVSPSPEALNTNSLAGRMGPGVLPGFQSAAGMIRVQNREFLGDISTGTDLSTQSYVRVLNPADALTFPWLNVLAQSFEQWSPLGMMFEFRSTSGAAISGTNSSLGSINMATQYDVLAPRFGSKNTILNHFFSASGKPSENILHPIECRPDQTPIKPLMIRKPTQELGVLEVGVLATLDAMYDARLYDLGRFEMLNTGSQAAYVGGELWITYDILLLKPRVNNGGIQTYTWSTSFVESDLPFPTPTVLPEIPLAITNLSVAPAPAPEAPLLGASVAEDEEKLPPPPVLRRTKRAQNGPVNLS